MPDYCYKVVIEPGTNKVLFCLLFTNDDSDTMRSLDLAELKQMLRYPLVAENQLK